MKFEVELTEEQAQAYQRIWPAHAAWSQPRRQVGQVIADAIREQMPKPKPPEPTEFGAVVRDKNGALWVRLAVVNGPQWVNDDPHKEFVEQCLYSDIDVEEVIRTSVA